MWSKTCFGQCHGIELIVLASDLVYSGHLRLFLAETCFVILMPNHALGDVLGNAFSITFNNFCSKNEISIGLLTGAIVGIGLNV